MGRPKHTVPAPEPPKRRWVTQAYVANHLGVTTRTVRDMTSDGRLTAYRMNQRFVRYDLNEVDAALTPYGGSVSMTGTGPLSQVDRDALEDRGLPDVLEHAEDPKLLHHDEAMPT